MFGERISSAHCFKTKKAESQIEYAEIPSRIDSILNKEMPEHYHTLL